MNWLRDNILKILIILGVTVAVIIVIAVIFAKPKGEELVSGAKYGELETKLQNAAIKYVNKNKKLLPKSTDDIAKINLATLEKNNYIGKIVAVDDKNVKCTGYVEVAKISEEENSYRYTPYISCGNFYVTKTIGDYIIDTETKDGTFERTTDAGLYKINDEYVFRGENVNNYILLDSHVYRIIKVDADKSLQLISSEKTIDSFVWDDRYNIERNRNDGINDFLKSRLHDSLDFIYRNTDSENAELVFSSKEKDYIVSHDFCIGKRALNDSNIYSGVECKEKVPLKVGLISLNEYARASIDVNCKGIFDKSCANYNYFNSLGTRDEYSYMTLTGVSDNTYQFYRVRYEEVEISRASTSGPIHPVVYINNRVIYSSGTGTSTDPYVIR